MVSTCLNKVNDDGITKHLWVIKHSSSLIISMKLESEGFCFQIPLGAQSGLGTQPCYKASSDFWV